MNCPHCEHTNPAGARFCEHCGAAQTHRCLACDEPLSPTARFCSQCGTEQDGPREAPAGAAPPEAVAAAGAVRSERRQITVLFCDIVGSTELAGSVDPEELRDVLDRYHAVCEEAIAKFEGYVAQYLGDGILVYFGYPQAHEDDAERAIRSALEIQRELGERFPEGEVRARIGIHTGLVVVGEIGSDARRETLALGDATGVAARIQDVAEAGGVAISEVTYGLTIGVFARDLGHHELKGLARPMRLYAVDRVFGGRRRPLTTAETPLCGRDEELERLKEAFEGARAGHGGAVLISGEPGIGKSRLVAALRDDVSATPRLWVDMACSPYTSGSAWRPIIDLFEERFAFPGDVSREQQSKLIANGLGQVPGLPVAEVVPYLLALLGLPAHADFPLPAAAPEQLRERTLNALCRIAEALASRDVLVMAVEDLHWADPSTLEYLRRLAELAPRVGLLLVCTARPELELPWESPKLTPLQLSRLPAWPTLELIEALAEGRSLPTAILRQIAERSDGVPLFIEELARAVLESDLPTDRQGRVPARSVDELAIPTTLQGSLMARLDRLGPAKAVAQLGATLGREFGHALLEKVAELAPATLRERLAALTEAGILIRYAGPTDETYRFKHALLQDTAYQSQLRTDRTATHARIATVLEEHFPDRVASEPSLVARHSAEGGLHLQAATHYQAAGALAASRYANDEAVRFLQLALEANDRLPDDGPRRERELALRLALAPPMIAHSGFDDGEVVSLHEQIALLCKSVPGATGLPGLLYLSRYYLRRAELERGAEVGRSILRIAREDEIPLMEVVGSLIIGTCKITTAPVETAVADLERALELSRSIHLPPPTSPLEPDLAAFIHTTLALSLAVRGDAERAMEAIQTARRRALSEDHDPTRIYVLAISTVTLNLLGDFEMALEWGQEALALAEGRGFHTSESQARTNVGWARVALGDLAGLSDVEAGLAQADEIGFLGGLCEYLEAAAEANRLAGRHERALELLERARQTYEATGESIAFAGRRGRVLGMLLQDQGKPAEAEAELREALERLEEYGSQPECLLAETELLRLAKGRDDEPEARARLVERCARFGSASGLRALAAARALLDETA